MGASLSQTEANLARRLLQENKFVDVQLALGDEKLIITNKDAKTRAHNNKEDIQ